MPREKFTEYSNLPSDFHIQFPNDQIHPPRDFDTASPGFMLIKDYDEALDWVRMSWDLPVINFVDGSNAPPTEVSDDRYVLLALSGMGTPVHADWDGASYNSLVQFLDTSLDGSGWEWVELIPVQGDVVYNKGDDTLRGYDGSAWNNLTIAGCSASRSDNAVALTGGNDAILFAGVGGNMATPYAVIPYAYDAAGNPLAVKITNRAATGFTAKAPKAGFLDYIAKQKTT